jgi:hypothetical protein
MFLKIDDVGRDSLDFLSWVTLLIGFVGNGITTLSKGSAYLGRRTICHARWQKQLEDHLELFRCHIGS